MLRPLAELGLRHFEIVSAVFEHTYPLTGQIYHLVIHQSIQIPNLDHHFLCPMQYRVINITISDVPNFLMNAPTPGSHSIVAYDMDNLLTPLVLPLYIHGVIAWLHVSKPSLEDCIPKRCQTIELTAEQLDCEPSDTRV